MFDTLSRQQDDPLLALIGQFRSDERSDKVDLGVGVYQDGNGRTPVLRSVKDAERLLLEKQVTKAYVGPAGDVDFLRLLWDLIAGRSVAATRVVGIQTVGGSGALRLAADMIRTAGRRRIWLGVPTWPNHGGIFAAAGLEIKEYPYFDVPTQAVLFDRMIATLRHAEAGDAALLHAGCHNPTGGSLSNDQWRSIAQILVERGVVPLIDLAYQGFGHGIEEDVAGLRLVVAVVPEALVAVSSSKSFGLYRERTGAIYAVSASKASAEVIRSNLMSLARVMYSMPPDHGAAIVRTILGDERLRADWVREIDAMRGRIVALRRAIAGAVGRTHPSLRAIAWQEGMFSLLPLTPQRVARIKSERGIYMPSSGRINITGLREDQVGAVMAEVVRD